jgi:hypothetical protein
LPTLAELKDVETIGVQMEFNTGETSAANDDTQPGEDSASEPAVVEASVDADAAPTEIASTAEAEEPPAEAEVENADASEASVEAEAEAEGEEDAESAVQAR